jgi:hypothetical protein
VRCRVFFVLFVMRDECYDGDNDNTIADPGAITHLNLNHGSVSTGS